MHTGPAEPPVANETAGDCFTGIMMAVFCLVGLAMASGARDIEISVFGRSLSAFGLIFVAGLVRQHYDMADRVTVRGGGHE